MNKPRKRETQAPYTDPGCQQATAKLKKKALNQAFEPERGFIEIQFEPKRLLILLLYGKFRIFSTNSFFLQKRWIFMQNIRVNRL